MQVAVRHGCCDDVVHSRDNHLHSAQYGVFRPAIVGAHMNIPVARIDLPEHVVVQTEIDPKMPGRTAYMISCRYAAPVQDAIDTISRSIDTSFGGVPGYAEFVGPTRVWGGFAAFGRVTVFQQEIA
jgi:hypothetical protein